MYEVGFKELPEWNRVDDGKSCVRAGLMLGESGLYDLVIPGIES